MIGAILFIAILAGVLFGAVFALQHYGFDALRNLFRKQETPLTQSQSDTQDLSAWQKQNFAAYYSQELHWGKCEDLDTSATAAVPGLPEVLAAPQYECADVKAPLIWSKSSSELAPDYTVEANPYESDAQASITLKAIREQLKDAPAHTLFFNPGGPGASGVSYLPKIIEQFPQTLRDAYSLATWDPRGVGASTPIKCFDSASDELADIYSSVPGEMPENYPAVKEDITNYHSDCARLTGSLLKYVDTQSAARDLELLSALSGDDKTNYFGFSYGTDLGAVYAGLFPQRVGKFALDGAALPDETLEETALSQAGGFQTELNAYLEDCLRSGNACPFAGQTLEYANSWIAASIAKLKASPLKAASGRELNDTGFFYGLAYTLYSKDSWQYLSLALSSLKKNASPDIFLILADAYFDYNSRTEHFESNMYEVNNAVNCIDRRDDFDLEREGENAQQIMQASPTLGSFFAYPEVGCEPYAKAADPVEYDESAPGAGPILVIGTLRDPATPYANAEQMAELLQSGVLLSYDSDGHTAFLSDTGALQKAVVDYFINGTVPENGTTYKPNG